MSEFRLIKTDKGFTLAEVLVVVVIIGILVAIAVPIYVNMTAKADQSVHDANVRTLFSAAQVYICKAWDETAKNADVMKIELADYIVGGVYPENPTHSGPYEVTIDAQGKINVSPAIGEYE